MHTPHSLICSSTDKTLCSSPFFLLNYAVMSSYVQLMWELFFFLFNINAELELQGAVVIVKS